jgi:hypothetical protein
MFLGGFLGGARAAHCRIVVECRPCDLIASRVDASVRAGVFRITDTRR